MTKVLHITHGSSATDAMQEAGMEGVFLAWDDVLHEGEVSEVNLEALTPIRSAFIASCGWDTLPAVLERFEKRNKLLNKAPSFDKVYLWFEADLYDQLQLIQLLHWFATNTPVPLYLIDSDTYLHTFTKKDWHAKQANAQPVSEEQLSLGAKAWVAFCRSSPLQLRQLLDKRTTELPHLKKAMFRYFASFPSTYNGLNRTQNAILKGLEAGHTSPIELFKYCQAQEEEVYMGDATFWLYLKALCEASVPFVTVEVGKFELPTEEDFSTLRKTHCSLSFEGKLALQAKTDWIKENGIDTWYGGTHLTTKRHWRWDTITQTIIRYKI